MTREEQSVLVRDIATAHRAPYRSLRYRIVPDRADQFEQAWLLVFFLENFARHTASQQLIIVEWADELLKRINNAGVPCGVARVRDNEMFSV